ncbi:uncharacterized protein N7473_001558 [Penicillium subrubescens]|uniref:uncharacterized protein n=1 Tax=Penicillium subrubescens TaxID=1316194 RepID=UPI002544F064|nr:uncharacterized protein N7473_001558 [Penicillium subrubescens]KAJ5904642.1 hypothetical protein N7473_001558 [Penicillium subrubescens]
MSLPEPPIWSRVILLILTIASFYPQIFRIQTTHTIRGISSLSILWCLIRATEQLTISIFSLYVDVGSDGNILLHDPPSKGDRFNLWHFAIVTVLFLSLFLRVTLHSDRRNSLIAAYACYLFVSITPLPWILEATSPFQGLDQQFFASIFYAVHSMLIYPIFTILGFVGIYYQAREILTIPFPNALSLSGLAAQAVIFTLVSVTLIWALPFPYEKSDGEFSWRSFSVWYGVIGWIIVDNFVFALGQAVLLALGLLRSSSSNNGALGGETEPLLGSVAH